MKVSSLLVIPSLLLFASHVAASSNNIHRRQAASGSRPGTSSTTPPSTSSTSSSSSSTSETTSTPSAASGTQNTSRSPTPTNTKPDDNNLPSLIPLPTAISTSTDADGSAITVTITGGPAASSSPTETSKPAQESDSSGGGGSGFGMGSIVAVSVAGGVALIGIIAFFVWKFSKKGLNDFDDNEAIKWPELNTHGGGDTHALPVHNTGRVGFDTGSEPSLSRNPSTSNYSNPDVGRADPYAVPPLPHMNPNQPFRDDPTAGTGYYDPYNGPIPGTLEHGVDEYPEAIPMTQMGGGPNTGHPMLYGGGHNPHAPLAAGRSSPGPQAAYAMGRASPAPPAAYGMPSHGHQAPYGYGPR